VHSTWKALTYCSCSKAGLAALCCQRVLCCTRPQQLVPHKHPPHPVSQFVCSGDCYAAGCPEGAIPAENNYSAGQPREPTNHTSVSGRAWAVTGGKRAACAVRCCNRGPAEAQPAGLHATLLHGACRVGCCRVGCCRLLQANVSCHWPHTLIPHHQPSSSPASLLSPYLLTSPHLL
jgi:hypothetical protein